MNIVKYLKMSPVLYQHRMVYNPLIKHTTKHQLTKCLFVVIKVHIVILLVQHNRLYLKFHEFFHLLQQHVISQNHIILIHLKIPEKYRLNFNSNRVKKTQSNSPSILSPANKIFCGFKSKCAIDFLCKYCNAFSISRIQIRVWSSVREFSSSSIA